MKEIGKAGAGPSHCDLCDNTDIFELPNLPVDPSKPLHPITIATLEATCRFIVSSASAFLRTAARRRPGLARGTGT